MGKIKNGILGGVSGKIGNVIGANWKGINYIKSLPSQYTDAKTAVQMANRSKFMTVVRLMQKFTEVIRVGFKSQAIKKTTFNVATALNYKTAISGAYPDYSIDFSKVVLSKGQLRGAENPAATSSAAGKLNLSWTDNSDLDNAQADDVAVVVAYQADLDDSFYTLNAASRSAGAAELSLPQSYGGNDVEVYLSFMALNGVNGNSAKSISNSVYLGSVSIT